MVVKKMNYGGQFPGQKEQSYCNGSTGAIPMLTEAARLFKSQQFVFLQAASDAGVQTWRQGLLKNGTGLAHGIAGNGYAFHCLFRSFSRSAKEAENKKSK